MDFQKKTSFHWILGLKSIVSSNPWLLPSMCCLATADDFSAEFLSGRHWLPPGTGTIRASDCLCAWLCLCASLLRCLHFLCLCLAGCLSACMVGSLALLGGSCLCACVWARALWIANPNFKFDDDFRYCKSTSRCLGILLFYDFCCCAWSAPCICMAMGTLSRLFNFIFFFEFFFRLSHGENTLENFV